jgi:antiviral helicase SLH1
VERYLPSTTLPPDQPTIYILTPAEFSLLSQSATVQIGLANLKMALLDSLQMLDWEYELTITNLLYISRKHQIKLMGMATSLNDVADLARWLHVEPSNTLFFRPNDRDISLSITAQSFPHSYSAALFKSMSKPLFSLLKSIPPIDQSLVFVPSRAVGRAAGNDLLTRCALEEDNRGFLAPDVDSDIMSLQLSGLADRTLAELLIHGIGLYDGGQSRQDSSLVLRLFAEGIIRVLLIHQRYRRNVPARGNVIVFGTEYPTHISQSQRTITPYSMGELFEMQSRAARHGQAGIFHLFCPSSARATILRLLDDGLSLESQLAEGDVLRTWLNERCQNGQIRNKQDAVDLLTSSYLALRLVHNPNYYDIGGASRAERLSRVIDHYWPSETRVEA